MLPVSAGSIADRAHDVAAARLALQALAHPEQRRPAPVGARDVLDETRRHARAAPRPRPACTARAAARARRSRARTRARRRRRRGRRGGSRAPSRTRARRRCRAAAADRCRPPPPVGVRIGSITITSPRRLAQPVVVLMRRARRGVRAPHDDAGRLGGRLRVEALLARAVDVGERDVPGVVADGVGLDLGRPEAVEEALREGRVDERARARVVRVEDARRAVLAAIAPAARRSPRSPPASRPARTAARPSARRAAAASSAAARDRGRRRCSRSSTYGRACRARRDDPGRRARA